MKKYMALFFIAGILLLTSCKDVEVYYPLPLSTSMKFPVTTNAGSYSIQDTIPTDKILQDVLNKLAEAGLSRNNLHRVVLEGVAYTVADPSVANVVVNGDLFVSYGSSQFTGILKLSNVNLTSIEGKPQTDALSSAGVSLLNQALQDAIFSSGFSSDIGVRSSGSLAQGTPGNVTFTMLVEFTITTIVRQKQSIFDPLG